MDHELNKFHLSKIQYRKLLETRIIRVTTVDAVDVDVADHAQADHAQARALYMLYFQAETTIIMSLNSESDMEDVRSRKVYTTLLARAKGILSVLPAVTRPVHTARRAGQHTIYMKTVNSAFQHDLIRHGHGMRYT